MNIRLFSRGRLCIYWFIFYLVTLITCFSQSSLSLGHFVVSRWRKSCQDSLLALTCSVTHLSHFPFLYVHTWKLGEYLFQKDAQFLRFLASRCWGWAVLDAVWWLERESSAAQWFGSTWRWEPSSHSAGVMPGTVGFQPTAEPPLCVGSGSWQLPPWTFGSWQEKKRQRESCAKYSLCHLFSVLWHLCKSPLLYCFLLTIKQNLSGSLFLFQRWCRTLIRWCQKASGDFALSTRALWVSEPVG